MAVGSGRVTRWWLDRPLRVKGLAVLAGPVLILVVTVAASFIGGRYQAALRQRALAVNAIANQSGQVLTLLLNAETGVRGYALAHQQSFLTPYNQAVSQAPAAVAVWSSSAPGEIGRADSVAVANLADRALSGLATIESGVQSGSLTDGALVSQLNDSKQVMDDLRGRLTTIQAREDQTLATRTSSVADVQTAVETIELVGLGIGVIGGVSAMVLFVRSIVRRIGAVSSNAHRLGVSEPLADVTPAADEIGQLEHELEEASTLLNQRSMDLVRFHGAAVDAAKAADELLAQISHELRTPLTAVMGFGRLIEMSDLGEEDAESVSQIVRAGGHMLQIIEQARTPTHTPQPIELQLEAVEVGPLVEEVLLLLGPLATDRHLTMTGYEGERVFVRADYHRFKQILINLGSNAVKYNREGGQVAVTCQPAGTERVRIAVTDSGEGIPPDMLDRVFVPFDRLDADKRGVDGTGIGLTLSKTFAEAMGGTIGFDSTLGEGSTFWVDLPSGHLGNGLAREGER
jgi:signal transduction histidine kinase